MPYIPRSAIYTVKELQKAPEIFPYIKMHIDKSKAKGQFLMSGFGQFHMMKQVTESLVGRVGILTLMGTA